MVVRECRSIALQRIDPLQQVSIHILECSLTALRTRRNATFFSPPQRSSSRALTEAAGGLGPAKSASSRTSAKSIPSCELGRRHRPNTEGCAGNCPLNGDRDQAPPSSCPPLGRCMPLWHVGLQAPSERGGAAAGGRRAGTPRPIFRPPPPRAQRAVAKPPRRSSGYRACLRRRAAANAVSSHRHPGDPLASGARLVSRHNRLPHCPAGPANHQVQAAIRRRNARCRSPGQPLLCHYSALCSDHLARDLHPRARGQSRDAASQCAGRRRSGHLTRRPVFGSRELRRRRNAGRSMAA